MKGLVRIVFRPAQGSLTAVILRVLPTTLHEYTPVTCALAHANGPPRSRNVIRLPAIFTEPETASELPFVTLKSPS